MLILLKKYFENFQTSMKVEKTACSNCQPFAIPAPLNPECFADYLK